MRRKTHSIVILVSLTVVAAILAWTLFRNETESQPPPLSMPAPHPGALDRPDLCPPGFAYFSGGKFTATRTGERWPGGVYRYEVDIEPFCLAKYEASIPGAGADDQGPVHMAERVFPAQVKPGVKPWSGGNWYHALTASTLQGWQLPAYEELQYVATSADAANRWIWGPFWNCRYSQRSWSETCAGPRPYREDRGYGVTGGPFGDSNYQLPVFDLHGNLSEWTATPWDETCYGYSRFSVFGGSYVDAWAKVQKQAPDEKKDACWKTEDFGSDNFAEQDQDIWMRLHHGGFRPKAVPGKQWKNWQPKTEMDLPSFPIEVTYFDLQGNKASFFYDPVSEMKTLNEKAGRLIDSGQYDQARTILRNSMQTYPYGEETTRLWNRIAGRSALSGQPSSP